jgi:hypothetical protein
MPQHNPIKFLLNRDASATKVSAPAFSITKDLATTAIILGPLTTALVGWLGSAHLTDGQYVTLTLALVAFIAILGAADVLARSYVTAHKDRHLYPFPHAVPGHTANDDVKVLAAIDANTLLVLDDNDVLMLVPKNQVNAPGVPQIV